MFANIDQRRSNRLVLLDSRQWTLLNGRDVSTRADLETVLGLHPDEMAVDFAASCVVGCVNTQRRDTMVKRARAAYAWRLATSEMDRELALYQEMVDESKRSIDQLDDEIRRAYQHYVYLVREEDGLHAAFVKLEDDQRTALSGNDVWDDMCARGDAVRTVDGLAGSYLHQLLDLSTRNYTLAEVVEKFWRDPAFPMIPNEGVARRSIFDALRPDADNVQWELVTSAGESLHVANPEQLALNSGDQYLRIAQPHIEDARSSRPESTGEERSSPSGAPAAGSSPVDRGPVEYQIHELAVTNRSLTDRDAREKLFQLISELANALDPSSGVDVQVASVQVELNAAKGVLGEVGARAAAAGASWSERPEDF
jgi:hypothetical protein